MAPLFPKLLQLLENKYVEQRGLKREVQSLSMEMEMVHAALMEVSRVPPDRLSEPDKIWARHIRELSYDMEDAIDAFMVRVAMHKATQADTNVFKKISHKATNLIKKIQERHHISDNIKDINNLSNELSQLRIRYTLNRHAPPVNTGIDPRVINLYKNKGELVGIEEARDQLIQMLMHQPEDESLKIISIVGCGGLDSNCGSKVIITTRNSEAVSTNTSDVYKLKPLSPEKSKELFYKRTSGRSGDDELVDKIIGKCDGVPLAIIAIASLLADRPLGDWQMVYVSLIFGHEEDNTRTILLYSYYDLPSYLKSCLLYLSMYPEDCFIKKSTLIWRWIAEGFVQLQNEGHRSLFEVGERYFNELLNRSMIQPAKEERSGFITGCHVHDIVLDLIRDLSHEENFVTVLGEKQFLPSESVARKHGLERKVRRMSVRNGTVPNDTTVRMPEAVRSLHARECRIEVSKLSSFQACRVLSLNHGKCNGDLKHLGKLLHLRYLELSGRLGDDPELPKEIGNLKFLQTLIINSTCFIRKLPPAVCELTQLICLDAYHCSLVRADRLGSLVCLEQLKLKIHKQECGDFVVELGKLTRLRVLHIFFRRMNEALEKALMQSLNSLQEIRDLKLLWGEWDVTLWKSWDVPPQQLRILETNRGLPPHLMNLPRLQHLDIQVEDPFRHQGFIVCANGFKNLRVCRTETRLKIPQGAMPRLELLRFEVRPGRDTIPDLEEMNLATLLSLKEVYIVIHCAGSFHGEVEEAEAVLRRAVEDHPNPPMLWISRFSEWLMLADDEIKPDKVVHALVKVRECRRELGKICDDVHMRLYRWLEEITCDIDCEGSSLSKVEHIEAKLRSDAAFLHPKRPKLVMNRVNQDKMLGDDDGAYVDSDDGASVDSDDDASLDIY
ncbi:hypothetical protein PR202_ga10904 [Eleusine coracana subsp. coracana]|uniref:Rx N-terminal domain-containing protein n=1 Tax=Eleusine coracana subsp. coracana TaxID=191504 RepID=A0AAV5C844_ELECO|nr:hypothetical protein PR202_ga10904 [Eleusine coracana subsp. coracana]